MFLLLDSRWEKFARIMLHKMKDTLGRSMPDILLFFWTEYTSQIFKLAAGVESKLTGFMRYFGGRLL